MIKVAKTHRSKLHVLHIEENGGLTPAIDNGIDFFNKHFKDVSFEYCHAIDKNIFYTIDGFIKSHDIKLLAMVGRKHSFLERFFKTHTVETMAFKIKIPFLVMPGF